MKPVQEKRQKIDEKKYKMAAGSWLGGNESWSDFEKKLSIFLLQHWALIPSYPETSKKISLRYKVSSINDNVCQNAKPLVEVNQAIWTSRRSESSNCYVVTYCFSVNFTPPYCLHCTCSEVLCLGMVTFEQGVAWPTVSYSMAVRPIEEHPCGLRGKGSQIKYATKVLRGLFHAKPNISPFFSQG